MDFSLVRDLNTHGCSLLQLRASQDGAGRRAENSLSAHDTQPERLRNGSGLHGTFRFKYKAYLWVLVLRTRGLKNNDDK